MVGTIPSENTAWGNLSHLIALFSNNPDGFILYSCGKMEVCLLAMGGTAILRLTHFEFYRFYVIIMFLSISVSNQPDQPPQSDKVG